MLMIYLLQTTLERLQEQVPLVKLHFGQALPIFQVIMIFIGITAIKRLGIQTSSPSRQLEVNGRIFASGNSSVGSTNTGSISIKSTLLNKPTYGYSPTNWANGNGDLVIGGFMSSGLGGFAGVATFVNQETVISAGDDLGVIQFVGKDDSTNGYCSSQIIASVAQGPGQGSNGGGILKFFTSNNSIGSSPQQRLTIDQNGDVGIGVTSPNAKTNCRFQVI